MIDNKAFRDVVSDEDVKEIWSALRIYLKALGIRAAVVLGLIATAVLWV